MRKTLVVFALVAMAACGKDSHTTSGGTNTDPSTASNPNVYNGPTIATQGRYVAGAGNSMQFAWAGSKITTRVKGASTVNLNLVTANLYEKIACFMNVSVDGGTPTTFSIDVNQTTKSYPLTLPDTNDHQITWTKITDAASCQLVFSGITLPNGGTLEATSEPPNRHIEFIGDSITNGYGVLGQMGGSGNLPYCAGNTNNSSSDLSFAKLTADQLYADYTLIAMNGRGLAINADGNGTTTHDASDAQNAYNVMPAMFLDAVPPLAGSSASLTPQAWDPTKYTPDVVVINLGTNDFSWYHFNTAGSCATTPSQANCNPTAAQFVTPYVAFLQKVRATYPSAHILLLSSVMLSDNSPAGATQRTTEVSYIQQAVSTFGDSNTSFLDLGVQDTSQPVGCDYHPSASTHASMATAVAAKIKSDLGWK